MLLYHLICLLSSFWPKSVYISTARGRFTISVFAIRILLIDVSYLIPWYCNRVKMEALVWNWVPWLLVVSRSRLIDLLPFMHSQFETLSCYLFVEDETTNNFHGTDFWFFACLASKPELNSEWNRAILELKCQNFQHNQRPRKRRRENRKIGLIQLDKCRNAQLHSEISKNYR